MSPADLQRLPFPYEAGWRAGNAFAQYCRAGGTRPTPLPDFYIGAHAESAGLTLVTRDTPLTFQTSHWLRREAVPVLLDTARRIG